MKRLIALIALFLAPLAASAATLRADTTLTITEPPLGNAYLAASELRVHVPLAGDLVVAAGSLEATAPIEGDALFAAGTASFSAPITGDVRAAGGRIYVGEAVGGELAALAGHLTVTGKASEVRAAGGTIELLGGASGPVVVYGGTIVLSGVFEGDVRVTASDSVRLTEGTSIRGVLEYNAPQEAAIPESAQIDGGVRYVGSASFVPTAEEAKTFALAGLGIFFLVRLVAAMLAAGLAVGLFPEFARRVTHEATGRSLKRFFMLVLLGFAAVVATPVLILLLLASFVGIGIAALLGATYVLMLMLGYLYAGVLVGSLFARYALKRPGVSWRSAAFGILVLYVIGLLPVIGILISSIVAAAALGAIIATFYKFSFGRAGME